MTDKLKEISSWLLEQGIGITRDVLNEKLEEAYKQGQLDGYHEQVETTLDNRILLTTAVKRTAARSMVRIRTAVCTR